MTLQVSLSVEPTPRDYSDAGWIIETAIVTEQPADKYILIVEDDPRNALVTQAMLKIAGLTKHYLCSAGPQVNATVAAMPRVDLVLLDLQLPGENGFEILQRLRRDSRFVGVPIVAITAQVMYSEVKRATEAGFDGFIGKPFSFDRFGSQIHRILQGEPVWEPR